MKKSKYILLISLTIAIFIVLLFYIFYGCNFNLSLYNNMQIINSHVKNVLLILIIIFAILLNFFVVSNKNINSNNRKKFFVMELSAMAGFMFGSYILGLLN